MKKIIISFLILLIFSACSSVKSAQTAINSGNYEKAINLALNNLRSSKTNKSNQPYIPMLEEAFSKITVRDLGRIDFLKQEGNPQNLEAIYNLYIDLRNRQELIRPLLPLYSQDNRIEATFDFKNYASDIINSKNELTMLLYTNAKEAFNSANKYQFRKVFEDLNYIEKISPNYKDTRDLIEEAHTRGTDYVLVSMKNNTKQMIPKQLSKDLLDFDTYGFDDLWTVYHSSQLENRTYDFGLELTLRNIDISPERIAEKEINLLNEIKDGWRYKLDKDGKEVLNAKGEKVKEDILIKVKCKVFQFSQSKSTEVVGQVKYVDFNSQQVLKTFPVKSGYIFEHIYANFQGDKRALTDDYKNLIAIREVRFPTNEQMVFDAVNDLKKDLKRMILRNKFRD